MNMTNKSNVDRMCSLRHQHVISEYMVATIIESSKDTFMLDGAVMYEVQPWSPGGFSRGGCELVLHRVWERKRALL